MTKDEIKRMAWEARLPTAWISESGIVQWAQLERFAALVSTAEREACAKLCDAEMFRETQNQDKAEVEGVRLGARFCAGYIRARSSEH